MPRLVTRQRFIWWPKHQAAPPSTEYCQAALGEMSVSHPAWNMEHPIANVGICSHIMWVGGILLISADVVIICPGLCLCFSIHFHTNALQKELRVDRNCWKTNKAAPSTLPFTYLFFICLLFTHTLAAGSRICLMELPLFEMRPNICYANYLMCRQIVYSLF